MARRQYQVPSQIRYSHSFEFKLQTKRNSTWKELKSSFSETNFQRKDRRWIFKSLPTWKASRETFRSWNRQRLNANRHDPWHSHSIKWIPNEFQLCHETSVSYRDRGNQFCTNDFPRFSLQCFGIIQGEISKPLENYFATAKRTFWQRAWTSNSKKMTEQRVSSVPVSANLIVHCNFFFFSLCCPVWFSPRDGLANVSQ